MSSKAAVSLCKIKLADCTKRFHYSLELTSNVRLVPRGISAVVPFNSVLEKLFEGGVYLYFQVFSCEQPSGKVTTNYLPGSIIKSKVKF